MDMTGTRATFRSVGRLALSIALTGLSLNAGYGATGTDPSLEDESLVAFGRAGPDTFYLGDHHSVESGFGTVYFHVLAQDGTRTPISTTTLIPNAKTYFITHGFQDGVGDLWIFPEAAAEGTFRPGFDDVLLQARLMEENFRVNENDLIDWQAFSAYSHQLAMSIFFYHQNKGESVNVILVDWGDFSSAFWEDVGRYYTNTAKFKVPRVGRAIADYLKLKQIHPSKVTLIGHSLGAHASGFAGQEVQRDGWGEGVKISTIIGMDAAGPTPSVSWAQFTFHEAPPQYRLSVGDADNVFDIHTSTTWGHMHPIAKYDLYVNATLTFAGNSDKALKGDWSVTYNHRLPPSLDTTAQINDHSYSRCFLANMFIDAVRLSSDTLPAFLTETFTHTVDGENVTEYKFYGARHFLHTFWQPSAEFRRENSRRNNSARRPLTIETFLLGHNPGGFFEDYDERFQWDPSTLSTADVGRSDLIPGFPTSRASLPGFSDYVKFWDDFAGLSEENPPDGATTANIQNYSVEHSPDFANARYHYGEHFPVRIVSSAPAEHGGLPVQWLTVTPDLYGYIAESYNSWTNGSDNLEMRATPPAGYRFGRWLSWKSAPNIHFVNEPTPWYSLAMKYYHLFNPKNPVVKVTPQIDFSDGGRIIEFVVNREDGDFPVTYSVTFDPASDPNGDYDMDGIPNKDDSYPKFNHLKASFTSYFIGYWTSIDADYPKTDPRFAPSDPRHKLELVIPDSIPESLVLASRAAKNPTSEPREAMAARTGTEEETLTAITGIAEEGLANLQGLQSVTVGKYIENIGDRAFANSTDLLEIIFTGKSAPEVGSDIFGSLTNTAIIVPADNTGYGNEGDPFAGLPVLYEALESFQNGELVRGLLAVRDNGQTAVDLETFSRLVSGLLVGVAEEYDIPAAIINPSMIESLAGDYLNEFSQRFGPTLSTIRTALIQLDEITQSARSNLKNAGDFLEEMREYLSLVDRISGGEFNLYADDILNDLRIQFEIWQQTYEGHFYGPEFQTELVAYLEQLTFDLATEFIFPDVQLALRQRVQDLRASIQNQIDSVFAMVEQAIRDKLTDLVAGLNLGEIDSSFLSPLDEVCAYGELNGHAQILGDRLDLLRIDAKFEMKAPDKLGFAGYLEIKCLNSQGNGGCVYEGAEFHEFTIGALDVPVAFLGGDVGMNIETSFTFADSGFPLRGLAGKFEMSRGEMDFETFKILSLGAAAAFGEFENYLACEASLQLNQYRVAGGLFFGRTCTIDPLAIAHEQTATLLWDDSVGTFTGALVYGFASIPISEALGIPASCMFYVSAGFGGGVFFSIDGPTFGGIMELDVGGEALCAVSVNGNVSLVGLKTGNDFRFSGRGHIGGKVGKCPFCLKFGKSVGIEYARETWKLSL